MGISTYRGYAIIIRHRFAGVTVRSLVSTPSPCLRTYPPKFRVPLSVRPSCSFRQDAVPFANSDCSHGGCTGWWSGAVGCHGDLSSLDTLHPSFHLRSIPMHGDPAAGQHRPIPSQKHRSLITQLSPWIVFSASSFDHRFTLRVRSFAQPMDSSIVCRTNKMLRFDNTMANYARLHFLASPLFSYRADMPRDH